MSKALQAAQAALEAGHRAVAVRDLDAAEQAYSQAARLAPDAAAPIHGVGVCAQLRGDLVGAEDAYRRALALQPGRAVSRAALGTVLLSRGEYAEGFQLRDAWRELTPEKAAPVLPLPRWIGEPLRGKRLLVWSEQGFGDQIFFARYAAALVRDGAQVTWVAPPELVRLLQQGLGVATLTPDAVDEALLSHFDAYCPSSALPIPFGGAALQHSYLSAAPRASVGRIGVMTAGNPRHPNDAARSLSADAAARLLALRGAMDLSPGATGAPDFLATAEIITGLDLVVSVDTAVAHLAGALGKPVWILLPEPAVDWRWGQWGDTTRWYSTAKLWRQSRPGDWGEVISAVVAFPSGYG